MLTHVCSAENVMQLLQSASSTSSVIPVYLYVQHAVMMQGVNGRDVVSMHRILLTLHRR